MTPSYNQGQFIEETIRSVLLQGYPNLEYIITDGGSTDESITIIRKYAPWLAYWESVKDRGQGHAINKALERATGLWFQNINSDDLLEQSALCLIGSAPSQADFFAGSVLDFSTDGPIKIVGNRNLSPKLLISTYGHSEKFAWTQPGVFMKTEYLRKIGGHPENMHYSFDFFTTCRYLEQFPNGIYTDQILSRFRIHLQSKTSFWGLKQDRDDLIARAALAKSFRGKELKRRADFESIKARLRIYCRERKEEHRGRLELGFMVVSIMRHPALILEPIMRSALKQKLQALSVE